MLFDIAVDPHETTDLAAAQPETKSSGAEILEEWTSTQLQRTGLDDPMDTVRAEGGPYHVRRHLPAYLQRLRTTGRSHWAHILEQRHAAEL